MERAFAPNHYNMVLKQENMKSTRKLRKPWKLIDNNNGMDNHPTFLTKVGFSILQTLELYPNRKQNTKPT